MKHNLTKKILAAVALLCFPITAGAYDGEHFVTCNLDSDGDNFLALRSCPTSSCEMLDRLPPDTFLVTMEPNFEGGWREVMVIEGLQDMSYSGQVGWVYGEYICEIRYR